MVGATVEIIVHTVVMFWLDDATRWCTVLYEYEYQNIWEHVDTKGAAKRHSTVDLVPAGCPLLQCSATVLSYGVKPYFFCRGGRQKGGGGVT